MAAHVKLDIPGADRLLALLTSSGAGQTADAALSRLVDGTNNARLSEALCSFARRFTSPKRS